RAQTNERAPGIDARSGHQRVDVLDVPWPDREIEAHGAVADPLPADVTEEPNDFGWISAGIAPQPPEKRHLRRRASDEVTNSRTAKADAVSPETHHRVLVAAEVHGEIETLRAHASEELAQAPRVPEVAPLVRQECVDGAEVTEDGVRPDPLCSLVCGHEDEVGL